MKRDNSSIKQTCPIIDNVISFIRSIDCEDLSSQAINDVVEYMEEIRSMNSALRDWGNDEYDRAESAENERDLFEGKYNDASELINELENEINRLTEEVLQYLYK